MIQIRIIGGKAFSTLFFMLHLPQWLPVRPFHTHTLISSPIVSKVPPFSCSMCFLEPAPVQPPAFWCQGDTATVIGGYGIASPPISFQQCLSHPFSLHPVPNTRTQVQPVEHIGRRFRTDKCASSYVANFMHGICSHKKWQWRPV